MHKGLRQGDPLAPFLFVIVAEGLNGLVKRAVLCNKLKPARVGKQAPIEVSCLQFADDTLFIGEASAQNVVVFKCILRCFELVSGLKVNFSKSKLAGISVAGNLLRRYAAVMNCRIMSVPFSYLGLPVGGSPCRLSFWDPVILRIQKKLSNWRRNSLSFGGRICLIRSVLASIPLYFLSVFRMPVGIRKKCKSLMRGFLWGGKEGENKMAWVSWDVICKPKAMGGLGLRD
ncbi:uncharacterized protein LOC130719377 [Lotus japonicus]|uniref:uncharacterized protein LOC130719377 n=1 Tax=Lotus japonicus TaxID=34305 RepID=UPI0025835427|nr:uncharacterized protein LOC130719377 [Lotus japonicus]